MVVNTIQEIVDWVLSNPIETMAVVLAMIGCGLIGMGLLLIHDKILK